MDTSRTSRRAWGLVAAGGLVTALGCDAPHPEAAEPPATERLGPAPVSAVEQITAARCRREVRCGHIGAGARYADVVVCEERVRDEWSEELSRYDCPGGIDGEELAECLEEIGNEDCLDPFDTLGRIVACRSSDLCRAHGSAEGDLHARDLPAPSGADAVRAIAEAHCDRETRCGRVGVGRHYVDAPACEAHLRALWDAQLSATACPSGIEHEGLGRCIDQLRQEDCAGDGDSLESLYACRAGEMCRAT